MAGKNELRIYFFTRPFPGSGFPGNRGYICVEEGGKGGGNKRRSVLEGRMFAPLRFYFRLFESLCSILHPLIIIIIIIHGGAADTTFSLYFFLSFSSDETLSRGAREEV